MTQLTLLSNVAIYAVIYLAFKSDAAQFSEPMVKLVIEMIQYYGLEISLAFVAGLQTIFLLVQLFAPTSWAMLITLFVLTTTVAATSPANVFGLLFCGLSALTIFAFFEVLNNAIRE